MFLRRILAAVGLLAVFGLWLVSSATAQSVRIDIPERRRPPPSTRVDLTNLTDLVGGLYALQDGYDRSRQGFVCALAYEDANANGQRDRGELGMPGWSFAITDAAGASVASGVTDGKGRFCNERPLAPGAYSVRQSIGGDWVNTEPGAPTPNVKPVTLRPDSSITVLFGDCRGARCGQERADDRRDDPPPSTPPAQRGPSGPPPPTPAGTAGVCVVKYNDRDGDGVRDAGEPVMSGWIFSVKTTGGAMLAFGTTNSQGQWCATGLPAGTVNVFETPKPGWAATDPANTVTGMAPKKTVVLVAGQTTNVVFGNRTAQVCVTKFNDLDGDGVKDANEVFMAGWVFKVMGPGGTNLDMGTTNAAGQWCTTQNLPAGPVSVVETQQTGWVSTKPNTTASTPTQGLTLVAGENFEVVFGNRIPPQTGKICVRKFHDWNSDGQEHFANEPGLSGWTFTITGPSGPVTLTTGADGKACTPANLAPGSYTITENPQAGWTNTHPGNGTASRVVNVTNSSANQYAFGNVPVAPGMLCVTKYEDVVRNRVPDTADPRLPGWTFEVRNSASVLVVTGVTDAQGRWCTTSPLPFGTYTVTEVQQPGWVVIYPSGPPNFSPPYSRTVLLSATRGGDLYFANIRAGRTCVQKYNDINGNGQRDAGEPPLAGFTFRFTLTQSGHATDVKLTTGPSGEVCVDLPPGASHEINEVLVPGWTITQAIGTYTVVAGQTRIVPFGNHQSGAPTYGGVCAIKFNDLNNDGVRQSNEPPLSDWTFSIQTPGGVLSGQTDSKGQWCTSRVLPPGTWTVTETQQPGWVSTVPGGAAPTLLAPVTSGQTTTVVFGNHQANPPPNLTVTKLVDVDCGTAQGIANPCVFRIRITNGGPGAYAGPVTFSDSVGFAGNIVIAGSTVVTAPVPPGWTCNASGPPNICTGNVNLGPNQSVDVVLTMNLTHVVMPKENCVRLTAPVATGSACVAF